MPISGIRKKQVRVGVRVGDARFLSYNRGLSRWIYEYEAK